MATYQNYTTLSLNNQTYEKATLLKLANKKLANNSTPNWEKSLFHFIQTWLDNNDFVEVKTSGSTGTPKLIHLKKEYMVNSAKATGAFFGLDKIENAKALLCLPCDYIAGKMMVVRSMVLNMNLLAVEPSSNPLINLEENAVDFAAMIPMQVAKCLKESKARLEEVKTLIIGGGAVNYALKTAFQALKTACYATYGMTETITHIAIKKLNTAEKTPNYQAIEGVVFSTDDRGCLVIDASHVSDEQVVTNDLVELKSETEFEWIGRVDNVINSGGVKISPEVIERKLEHQIKKRFFIASKPDEILGEAVVFVIEDIDWTTVERTWYEAKFRIYLEKYEIPKHVYIIHKFSETANKKVHRQRTIEQVMLLGK